MSTAKKDRLSLSKKRKLNDGQNKSSTPTIMSMFKKQREKQTGEMHKTVDESGDESDVVITKVIRSRSHICESKSLTQHNSQTCCPSVQGFDSTSEGDKLNTQSFQLNDETVKGNKHIETSSKFKKKTRISVKEQSQRSDSQLKSDDFMDDKEEENSCKNSESCRKTSGKNSNSNLMESRYSPRLKAKHLSAEDEVIVLEDDFIPRSSKKRKLTLRKAKTDLEICEMKKSCKKEKLNEGTSNTILEDDVHVVGSDRDTEQEEMEDQVTDMEYRSGVKDDNSSHTLKHKNMEKKKHKGKSIVQDQEKNTSESDNEIVSNSLKGKPKSLTKISHKDVINPSVLENSENKTDVMNDKAEAEVIVLEDDFIPCSSKKRKLTLRKAKTDSEISDMKKSCKKTKVNEGTSNTVLEDDVHVVGSDRDTEQEEMEDQVTDMEYRSGVKDDNSSHTLKRKNMEKNKHKGKSIVQDQEKNTSECDNQIVSSSLKGKPKSLTKISHKGVMNPSVLENLEKKTDVMNDKDEDVDADEGGVSEDPVYQVPYYLENFHTIIDSVMDDTEYRKLFNASDMQYITAFRELPEPCQKLYVRIFGRKLSWLPMTKLKYPGISDDIPSLVDNLISAGFLMSGEDLDDLPVLLKLLPGPELKSLAKTFHINTVNTTKPKLVELFMKKSQQSSIGSMFGGGNKASSSTLNTMIKRAKGYLGKVSRLQEDVRAVYIRLLMLFCLYNTNFDEENGNVGQNQLFQMLMVNIGRVTYPNYTVNKSRPVFKDREAVVRFETALQLEMDLLHLIERSKWDEAFVIYEQAREVGELILKNKQYRKWDASLPEFLRLYTAGCIYIRIANQGVEILQRRKKYADAVSLLEEMLAQKLYCNQYRGHWYERLTLNLDAHLKKPAQSLDVIKRGLSDEHVRSGRKLAIYERAKKICEAPKSKFADRMTEFVHDVVVSPPETSIEGMVISDATSMGMKYQFVMQGDSDSTTFCAVEELVLDHYKNNGYPNGLHAEGSIIGNLFTLYFWDILYMDVVDVFQGPFQSCPLDLYTREFYEQRKSVVDLRLKWIRQATEQELTDEIKKIWEEHSGKMCIGLNWEKFSGPETHQGLVSCMNGQMIAGILERYVKDPRHTRSGFPDLTLWNTDTKMIKISEVKGPNDRLSYKQILWIDYLLKLGIDAEVCYVKAVGSKKLKPKSAK